MDLVVDYFLNKSIEEQYTKFVEGFYSVCPRSLLMVRATDLLFNPVHSTIQSELN